MAHQPFSVPLRLRGRRAGQRGLVVGEGGFGRVRFVDCEVAALDIDPPQGLAGDGGLAGLARPEEGDDVVGRLGKPLEEGVDLGALEGLHAQEITLLSKNTQWRNHVLAIIRTSPCRRARNLRREPGCPRPGRAPPYRLSVRGVPPEGPGRAMIKQNLQGCSPAQASSGNRPRISERL